MMKNILYFAFILFALASCQKEEPLSENKDATPNFSGGTTGGGGGNGGGGGGGTGTFSATVDGIPFTPLATTSMQSAGYLIISSIATTTDKNLSLSFDDNITTGVYDFSGFFPSATYNNLSTQISYEAEGPGIEILSHNVNQKLITGNFFFTAYNPNDLTDSVVVTNGHFEIDYN